MSLSKATTFHVPSSPPSDNDPVLSIAHLPRRSSTASKTLLALMLGKEQEVVDSIASFEEQFSGSTARWSDKNFKSSGSRRQLERRSPLDIDGLKGAKVSHEHLSDSGLGTSISSADSPLRSANQDVESAADRLLLLGVASDRTTSETDQASVKPGKVTAEGPEISKTNNRPRSIHSSSTSQPANSALTKSASPQNNTLLSRSGLGRFATKKIKEFVFEPIYQEEEFEFFHPLAHSLEDKVRRKSIKCLRDLEKSLVFEPLTFATSPFAFRRFAEFSVQLVLDTYPHLTEPEQRRSTDRPYDNGYFLDLVQQVSRLAGQIGAHRESGETDEMGPSADDRVTLEGGMAETGNIAELVRWDREGKAWSMRTGELYEPAAGIKRSSSFLEDDIERSMARRKKGAEPLSMTCSDPTCDKVFTRKCDLAKHEKTHSRPFKCTEPTCKYHEMGLPTEKERDRHVNDKHSANPHFYHCSYCPFKTKRDSNCKQHMEKKHGWTYDRVKGNGRTKTGGTPHSTPMATPETPSMSTPVSVDYSSVHESTAPNSTMATPMEQALDQFPEPHLGSTTPVHLGGSLFGATTMPMPATESAYYSPQNYQNGLVATPYSAMSTITEQQVSAEEFDMYVSSNMHVPTYSNAYGMTSPLTPPDYDMKMNPNTYNMPMTPASSGNLAPGSRNHSVSFTTPLSDLNSGLAQTISPQFPLEDDMMEFAGPMFENSQFAHADGSDLPMNDFDLFGSDGYMNHAAGEVDVFSTYTNLVEDGYEA